MKRNLFLFLILLFLLSLSSANSFAGGQEDIKERAAKAIKTKDYSSAIAICLDGLKRNHADSDLNLLLSRAYAYSGQWDMALSILNELALAHPENTDILLFRARLEAWKKDYSKAEKGYNEVLRLNPANTEAMTGLAEVASWQGEYAKSLTIYGQILEREPSNPDIYFRLGRVYLWDGNYDKAKENLQKALSLDPKNSEYKRVLKKTSPRLLEKYELRYEYQTENFSDGRKNYIDQNLVLQLNLFPNFGPILLKVNQTDRHSQRDYRFGFEIYPHLWKGAYAYLDFTYSPRATQFPESLYQVELYQGVLSSAEISIGCRRINFIENPVSLYLGSFGYYFGKYYAFLRFHYSPEKNAEGLAWMANLRRYFSENSYFFVGYGQGSKPVDIVTLEDFLIGQSHVFLAGFNWYIFQRIRLQLYFTLRNEGDVERNTLFLSTGYKW